MISLDTNVIVRVVTQDDPRQCRAAEALMRSDTLMLPKTVLVEVAWVLKRAYRLDRKTLHSALTTLVGIEDLVVEDRDAVVQALAWHAAGMELADALHVASSADAEFVATFDERFAKAAARVGCRPPVRWLGAPEPRGVAETRARWRGRKVTRARTRRASK